jgi:hypothetical protein
MFCWELEIAWRKRMLVYNSLRLQEAVSSSPLFSPLHLDRLSFRYVLIFQPHLTIRAKYILTKVSTATTSKPLERNGFHFRNGPPFPGVRRFAWLILSNLEEATHMKKEYIKPFVWGSVVGAIVLLIVIFSAGWVVTSNSAKAQAHQISTDAVVDRLAPISVAQFMQDPNRKERLKELKLLDSWKRAEYVKKQGWATMPGEKESDYNVAEACAKRLVKLEM